MNDSRIAFIIGCGRSGTHYIAQTIAADRNVSVMYEEPIIFNSVVSSVTTNQNALSIAISEYTKRLTDSALLVDKSHPNLFNVEQLLCHFPNAKFVGIYRNVFQTISSMLVHGCADWGLRYSEMYMPNKFLGITHANLEYYKSCSIVGRCVFRWVSHMRELKHINKTRPCSIFVINYSHLLEFTETVVKSLSTFLSIDCKAIPVKRATLCKWTKTLSTEQIDEIYTVLNYLAYTETEK